MKWDSHAEKIRGLVTSILSGARSSLGK